MIFLTDNDFDVQIRAWVIGKLKAGNTSVANTAELMAIEEIQGYLSAKYDVAAVFAATGTARNPLIVMRTIDVMLYHMHSAIAPDNVPELRDKRYREGIDWLEKIAMEKIQVNLPLLDEENPSSTMRFGGDKRTSYRW